MPFSSIERLFHVDTLSIIMLCLITFVGCIVHFFSKRYMEGDHHYRYFTRNMAILLISVSIMTIADNLMLFLAAWTCLNWMLVKLMVHKSVWKAAKASGKLASFNFMIAFGAIILALTLMYKATGSLSIQYILHNTDTDTSGSLFIPLILILVAAMAQSAIWPFHRWLTSSLNSPTPVSAIMHAGIVNGGGFLLARFAPLYLNNPTMLNIIFTVGLTTALMGSLWKLMQHDVKRMLACSTIGQMGFMFAQCGLGLFTSAIAHIFWHGIFKAYLFLASGNAAQEQRHDLNDTPNALGFLLSILCGALASYLFAFILNINSLISDTRLIMVSIICIVGSQLALVILGDTPLQRLPIAIALSLLMGSFYAGNVYLFDSILSPLNIMQPQPLNTLHIIALVLLISTWLCLSFFKYTKYKMKLPNAILSVYVKTLNSSQPHPATITTHRKGYDHV
jgi:NAD(P)H-quinone oxidoreductase subunit 5